MPMPSLTAFARSILALGAPPNWAAEAAYLGGAQVRCLSFSHRPKPPVISTGRMGQIFTKVASGEMDMRIGRSLGYIASVLVKTTELSNHEIWLRAIEQIIRAIKSEGTPE